MSSAHTSEATAHHSKGEPFEDGDQEGPITRHIRSQFEYGVMPEPAFRNLSPIEQLDYIHDVRDEGLLSVRYTGFSDGPGGVIVNRTRNYIDLLGGDEIKQKFMQECLEEVETTNEHGFPRKHEWFADTPSIILEDQVGRAAEKTLEEYDELGEQAKAIIHEDGIDEPIYYTDDEKATTIRAKKLAIRLRELAKIYQRNVDNGTLAAADDSDTTYAGLIKHMGNLDNAVSIIKHGPAHIYDERRDVFQEAHDEIEQQLGQRSEDAEALITITKELQKVYRTFSPLYLTYAEMVLDRMKETNRPMVFLYRDGQFLRKIVNQVRRARHPDVDKELVQEGLLSRTVFKQVDDLEAQLKRMQYDFLEGYIASSDAEEPQDTFAEIEDIEEKINTISYGYESNKGAKIKRLQEEQRKLLDSFLVSAREGGKIPPGLAKLDNEIRLKQEEHDAKKADLIAYLEDRNAFEPFLDLADTGVGGSIMSVICDYRDEYWDQNIENPEFRRGIEEGYNVSLAEGGLPLEEIKGMYTGEFPVNEEKGYAVRTYMLITSREKGDSELGYTREDQRGTVYPVIDPEIIAYLEGIGLFNLEDYETDSITMFLTHAYESRLNGYLEPIQGIEADDEGAFKIVQGETLADTNENVQGVTLPKPGRELAGLQVTGDPARLALNYACMRQVREGIDELLKQDLEDEVKLPDAIIGAPDYLNRKALIHTCRMLDVLTKLPPSLINIVRFKTPRREDINAFIAYEQAV
ncbi:hypothetical protein GF389_00120 [Candidatus Dojkabacteria bacterium]|nr:hypothetical protein [Candidatus Dojkabacteria bacterium]